MEFDFFVKLFRMMQKKCIKLFDVKCYYSNCAIAFFYHIISRENDAFNVSIEHMKKKSRLLYIHTSLIRTSASIRAVRPTGQRMDIGVHNREVTLQKIITYGHI